MPTANEIRQQFIDFFVKKHGHTFVPSSSVVPLDDPTLMFTNAGMNQFKDVFLGTGTRAYKRAVDTQKCIRVSGKHNDLEEVGRDTYHHTFFEMLGNWSFGDYYKAEAIQWAWELLTKDWGIDKSRLHATVFGGDKEFGLDADEDAAKLWTKVTDIDPTHVHRFGKKDNFWMMGETGPCGPCSEIHYDRTESGATLVNKGDPRVVEIWNLVFIQFNAIISEEGQRLLAPLTDPEKRTPILKNHTTFKLLPAKHVDTGMGFERICAVLQKKDSNYDTDVFGPIMDAIAQLTGKNYGGRLDEMIDIGFRVIADHVRMATFAITDGARPGNKKRDAVLRSVIRRAVRFCFQYFNQREPVLYKLVPALADHMGSAYPELKRNPGQVAEVLRCEEAEFLKTIGRGMTHFASAIQRGKSPGDPGGQILAADMFHLHTTYGFPPDLTRQMAAEYGMTVDEEGYQRLMKEHEEKSRAVSTNVGLGDFVTIKAMPSGTKDRMKWSGLNGEGEVQGWILNKKYVNTGAITQGETAGLVLNQTCFYAEAGGQVGDKGMIESKTGKFEVEQTTKVGDAVAHVGRVVSGQIKVGQDVKLMVSPEREFTIKNHTATHLLHWALHKVLGEHVEQRGSRVKPDEFTFDFSHTGPLTEEEKVEVERLVNEKIYQDLEVTAKEMSQAEAKKLPGVKAFFGDKYGDVVRVITIGDGFSQEFCGGTHLSHTGQAGFFKIVGEEAVGKGVRRLVGVTGPEAVKRVQQLDHVVHGLADKFRCKPEELPARIEGLQDEIKKLQQQLKKGAATDLAGAADKLLEVATDVGGVKVIVGEMPAGPEEQMRQQLDRLRQKVGSAVIVFAWTEDSKVGLLAAVTDDLVKKGAHAGKLIGQVAKVVGGGGGGKPTMAQAGGKDPAKIADALDVARKVAAEQLGGAK